MEVLAMTIKEKIEKIKMYIIYLDLSSKSATGSLKASGFEAIHTIRNKYNFNESSGVEIVKLLDEISEKLTVY